MEAFLVLLLVLPLARLKVAARLLFLAVDLNPIPQAPVLGGGCVGQSHLRPLPLLASEQVYSAVVIQPALSRPVAAVCLAQTFPRRVAQARDCSGIHQGQVRETLAMPGVCLALQSLRQAQVLEVACLQEILPLAPWLLALPPELDLLLLLRLLRVVLLDLGCSAVDC